jgi:hypothetical protein
MKLRAEKLLNVDSFFDFWDKSDPFIKFMKIRSDNTCIEVHRSEVVKDNLNPSWLPLEIQAARLINPQKNAFKSLFHHVEFKSGTGKRTARTSS